MRFLIASFLAFGGLVGLTLLAFPSDSTDSNDHPLRGRMLEGAFLPGEERGFSGFWASMWALITGSEETNWKVGEDNNLQDLGAHVYEMHIDDLLPEQQGVVQSGVHLQKISQNGLNGDKWNRYAWSSALDNDENLWIGTFNVNRDDAAARDVQISILRAPWGMKRAAMVDGFLRYFHGQPIFESAGGQVLKRNPTTGEFDLMFQADEQHVGFRSMTVQDGDIYVGSANGPDEPLNREPYDFSFYKPGEGVGAKVFTNAGGEWHMLDDQGLLDSTDKSIRKMAVSSHSNRLFVGTESHPCSKLLIYDKPTNTWKQIQQDGVNFHCKTAISEFLDLGNGKMLIGTWQPLGHAVYLLDETNGDKMTKIETPSLWTHFVCGVMELRVFKNQLYVGLLSFGSGFTLIRTSNLNVLEVTENDWEVVGRNGFAREQRQQLGARVSGNEYCWSSGEVNGVYVIGTMSITQRGLSTKSDKLFALQPQLWASRDGENWTLILHDEDLPSFLFGYRTMQVTSDNTLYMGTASNLFEVVDRQTAIETVGQVGEDLSP